MYMQTVLVYLTLQRHLRAWSTRGTVISPLLHLFTFHCIYIKTGLYCSFLIKLISLTQKNDLFYFFQVNAVCFGTNRLKHIHKSHFYISPFYIETSIRLLFYHRRLCKDFFAGVTFIEQYLIRKEGGKKDTHMF